MKSISVTARNGRRFRVALKILAANISKRWRIGFDENSERDSVVQKVHANLIASFVLIAAAAAQAQDTSPGTATRLGLEEGYVTTDHGTRLFYQKTGSGSQVVIVPLRLYTFDAFKQLGDQFTVIAYDTRGRGRSDPIPDEQKAAKLSIHHDVADLERIRQHFNVQKSSLIGYSYLGLMIVMYGMEYPDRVERIVQLGPVPIKFGTEYPDNLTAKDEPPDPKLLRELRRLRSEENYHVAHPKEYCEKEWSYTRLGLVGNPGNADKVSASPCEMPNEWPINLMKHFESSFASVQKLDISKEKIAAVKVPVLTIHGTKDRNAPYGAGREWALTLPNARLLTIKGGAHQSFDEFREIVVPAVRRFLAGNWPEDVERVTALNPSS
jgi:pimeloyl-ACP methyl ester carboxylesterase